MEETNKDVETQPVSGSQPASEISNLLKQMEEMKKKLLEKTQPLQEELKKLEDEKASLQTKIAEINTKISAIRQTLGMATGTTRTRAATSSGGRRVFHINGEGNFSGNEVAEKYGIKSLYGSYNWAGEIANIVDGKMPSDRSVLAKEKAILEKIAKEVTYD